MEIPHNAFRLKHYASRKNSIDNYINNLPTVNIEKRTNGYLYLEIDFITCNYCLSPYGQADIQNRLNHVMYYEWLNNGFNLKTNNTTIQSMYSRLRINNHIMIGLLDYLNTKCDDPLYWLQYREGESKLDVERYDPELFVSSIYHPKNDTNKLKLRV